MYPHRHSVAVLQVHWQSPSLYSRCVMHSLNDIMLHCPYTARKGPLLKDILTETSNKPIEYLPILFYAICCACTHSTAHAHNLFCLVTAIFQEVYLSYHLKNILMIIHDVVCLIPHRVSLVTQGLLAMMVCQARKESLGRW